MIETEATAIDFSKWNAIFEAKVLEITSLDDPSHDILHLKRVVRTAIQLCKSEKARMEIVLPAAWFHDFINVPKNDPRRKQASRLSAQAAWEFLKGVDYPSEYLPEIAHAIEAHSFSAGIESRTIEAQIIQDADRLDGIGAIGIARCFVVAGLMKRSLYSEQDPFCESRQPDDLCGTVDHFYTKLLKVTKSLKTKAAQVEGEKRLAVMQTYLKDLSREISFSDCL
jgi:uncharacterized protein